MVVEEIGTEITQDKGIQKALGDDLQMIKKEIQQKDCTAWSYNQGQFKFIIRLEKLKNGKDELVGVACAGRSDKHILSQFVKVAKEIGAKTIRIHTENNKWLRFLSINGLNFIPTDEKTIYRLEVA